MMNPYLMADDLSGALEAGAAFHARGWSVVLEMGHVTRTGPAAGTVTLRSTETRNTRGEDAAAVVRLMLAGQRAAGAQLLYKKIDSTLRGPVAAEIKALLEELQPPLLVVCPASPVVGRTVRDGRLLVDGRPVAETEFRRDPGWPVRESSLVTVLAGGGVDRVARLALDRLRRSTSLAADCSRGVLVSDAETESDLSRLVELVRHREPDAVFVGAGGLARALASATAQGEGAAPAGPIAPRTGLFVSGSMSAISRRQVECLRDHHAVPLHEVTLAPEAPHAIAAEVGRALATRGFASLTIAPTMADCDPGKVLQQLTAVVKLLCAAGQPPDLLAVTGGETARAMCTSLDIGELKLIGEFEAGVVTTIAVGAGKPAPKWIVIKPGGFGSADLWVNLIRTWNART